MAESNPRLVFNYNPERMNFGALRVLNDDIMAQEWVGTHPHDNMEIILSLWKRFGTQRQYGQYRSYQPRGNTGDECRDEYIDEYKKNKINH